MDYNKYSKEIYEQNKAVGWWDDPDRCKLTLLQLVSTEIAEATEAERKDLMDDHLPHRKGGEVELADAMIRLLDMAGAYGWRYLELDIEPIPKIIEEKGIGAKHFYINCRLSNMKIIHSINSSFFNINYCFSTLVELIEAVAKSQGYDIESAMIEKLEYNAKRQDHKRSEREKKHGKKF